MSIKIARAAKISAISQYPRTWAAIIDRIPAETRAALTSCELAALIDAMHAQYMAGRAAVYMGAS